jgi:hypothetical protein
MRRFAIHPDYLQSVPKGAREAYRSKGRKAKDTAREAATDSTPAPDSANAPQDRAKAPYNAPPALGARDRCGNHCNPAIRRAIRVTRRKTGLLSTIERER